MSLTASVRQLGAVTVIDLNGRVTLGDATGLLRETVQKAAENSSAILLNLAVVATRPRLGRFSQLGAGWLYNRV